MLNQINSPTLLQVKSGVSGHTEFIQHIAGEIVYRVYTPMVTKTQCQRYKGMIRQLTTATITDNAFSSNPLCNF